MSGGLINFQCCLGFSDFGAVEASSGLRERTRLEVAMGNETISGLELSEMWTETHGPSQQSKWWLHAAK